MNESERDDEPLTLEEFKELAGKPVYCAELGSYGIVKYETIGRWANIPFLLGAWHKDGVAVNFEYNIKERGLRCYRLDNL